MASRASGSTVLKTQINAIGLQKLPNLMYTMVWLILRSPKAPKPYAYNGFGYLLSKTYEI